MSVWCCLQPFLFLSRTTLASYQITVRWRKWSCSRARPTSSVLQESTLVAVGLSLKFLLSRLAYQVFQGRRVPSKSARYIQLHIRGFGAQHEKFLMMSTKPWIYLLTVVLLRVQMVPTWLGSLPLWRQEKSLSTPCTWPSRATRQQRPRHPPRHS